ncbi:hypothetical protein G6F15_003540 [Rhizopus arrhizus]|nr:hypothetical protein G6F15_003540 [Rhizopus arrhizus]
MSLGRTLKLNTGASIPALGLGTWQSKPNEVYDAVLTAIQNGYRHIDTAFIYGNEKEVGQAIKDSKVPREELFITTKLWNNSHRPEDVEKALQVSLDNLQLDYLDLYLIHCLEMKRCPDRVLALEKLVGEKVRAIGVSNFNIAKLEKLAKVQKIVPAVNQIELHPFLPQEDLLQYCKEHNIVVTAYSPLGSTNSPFLKDEKIAKIAEKYNATPAQILISWGIQRGCSVIPKSVTPSRIISNFKDVELNEEDFKALNTLVDAQSPNRLVDPYNFWGVDVFDQH